jgi:hypothetical protein
MILLPAIICMRLFEGHQRSIAARQNIVALFLFRELTPALVGFSTCTC